MEGIGISKKKFIMNLFVGIGVGVVIMLIKKISPTFSIGIPMLPLQLWGKVAMALLVAPILEEIVFRYVAFSALMSATKNKVIISMILASAGFTLFHFLAYTSGIYSMFSSASGAFIGAFVSGMIFQVIAWYRKDLIPSIVAHFIFNAFILAGSFLVIAV